MDIVEEMRGFSTDHEPDGWPAVRMRQITALCDEIDRLRYQVEIGKQVVNLGVGLMTTEQLGQWVGVRHFLEAGTDMYPPFPEEATPNAVAHRLPEGQSGGAEGYAGEEHGL